MKKVLAMDAGDGRNNNANVLLMLLAAHTWLKWQILCYLYFSTIKKKRWGVTVWPWCLLNKGLRTRGQPQRAHDLGRETGQAMPLG